MSQYLHNELFEGILSKAEYLSLYDSNSIPKDNVVLIAIHEPDDTIHPPEKVEGFNDVLQMQFWDIEEAIGRYKPLDEIQAKELRDFIEKNKDKKFLIHCAAGISRSAGVGCAVECIVNYNSDTYSYKTGHSDIKSHWRYSPNPVVFYKIMGAK